MITLFLSLAIFTSAITTTEITPRETPIVYEEQMQVYDIPTRKKSRK